MGPKFLLTETANEAPLHLGVHHVREVLVQPRVGGSCIIVLRNGVGRKEDMKRNNKIAKLELGTNEVSLDAMHSHTQKDGCVHFPPLPRSRLSMMAPPPPPSSVYTTSARPMSYFLRWICHLRERCV